MALVTIFNEQNPDRLLQGGPLKLNMWCRKIPSVQVTLQVVCVIYSAKCRIESQFLQISKYICGIIAGGNLLICPPLKRR